MRLKTLVVKNLRSIKELEISFDDVTALIGGNNAGKSTILRALQIFFEAAPKVPPDDYYNREEEQIEVLVQFIDLVHSILYRRTFKT